MNYFRVLLITMTALTSTTVSITAPAEICKGVPDCQEQQMGAVSYKALETKGWAYYCTGEYPYYWNNATVLGLGTNYKSSPSCFTVAENPFGETTDHPSKADFTITNWCSDPLPEKKSITVTLGCSKVPQEAAPACPGKNMTTTDDPKCPLTGPARNTCSTTGVGCIQTYTEQCSDGKIYYCTKDLYAGGLTYCMTCP
ncbi:MAG: hypothetical protein AAF438_16585 [Pseudomonadota bacterium]